MSIERLLELQERIRTSIRSDKRLNLNLGDKMCLDLIISAYLRHYEEKPEEARYHSLSSGGGTRPPRLV